MIRTLIQSGLCLALCPLLAAQQVSQDNAKQANPQIGVSVWAYPIWLNAPTLPPELAGLRSAPDGMSVEITSRGPESSASSKVGDPIRFVVTKDVVVDGSAVLKAGTHVDCTITKVRGGKRSKGELRIEEVAAGNSVKLRLAASPQSHGRGGVRRTLARTGRGIEIAVEVPFIAIFCLFCLVFLYFQCQNGC